MKNFLYLIYLLLLMACLLTPLLARAETDEISWSIQPRLTAGLMNYRFEYGFNAPNANQSSQTFNDYMPFMTAGAMLTYNNCFADTYFQQSVTGKDDLENKPGTELTFNTNNEFDRRDYALTLGCQAHKNVLFFAGYKAGQTDIQMASTKNWHYERIDESGTGTAEFESDGFFIGAAYTYPFGKGLDERLLSVKVALAKLDAEYHQHNSITRNNRAVGDGSTTFDDDWFLSGNTLGWTAGVSLTDRISFFKNHLYYRISLDYFDYDFDVDSAYLGITPVGNAEYEMKESMFSLQLQVFYPFQF